ncbi:AAA-like domain-containing protein [Microcoleus sp. FACHB-68]|uniref:AAA-like domain-containing protein n=1 Tax=Microcoleus sp. FACHB-68 TaxID=2692826 RepID=UPI00168512C5|nr:AAA-like domain-containing protein [Microcoleus sp. FACHB-68]MBD1940596.1 AAA-like domain-containing protein [Microcoleus sp. FACHB-68]
MEDNGQGSFYQVQGGTLPLEAPTYVGREADEELYNFARSTHIYERVCYVLAPRQMGKSSLMVKTAQKLTEEGAICVQLNLHRLGSVESEKFLWFNILREICKGISIPNLNLLERLDFVWYKNQDIQPSVRFEEFLIEEILSKIEDKKLVIFIDEIQTLINWNLQDSFIGEIKALSDKKDKSPLTRLTFVLLGVAKPSDFVTKNYPLNVGIQIELSNLTGDCEPLRRGLDRVTKDANEAAKLLDLILYWTGGQPFLTQVVCNLVISSPKLQENSNLEEYVAKIVQTKIIKNWRKQDRNVHFQEIENYFIRGQTSGKLLKLKALALYHKILTQSSIRFKGFSEQWELIISGLVTKEEGLLKVTNPIYQQVFNLTWVREKQAFLQEDMMAEPIERIYNRDVFILIDQSASMSLKDVGSNKSRWQQMEELVMGHVGQILTRRPKDNPDLKVCEEVAITTFNRRRFRGQIRQVSIPEQVRSLFLENNPDANTHIAPALRKCLENWFDGREKITLQDIQEGKSKGAFFIIYIDGGFDDLPEFKTLLKQTCAKIDDERIVKFIIIGLGLGKDINLKEFDDLEVNLQGDKDLYDEDCRVVVFEIEEDMDDIIELMQRHLQDSKDREEYRENLREGSRHKNG